jgi:putative restriction endonuclease
MDRPGEERLRAALFAHLDRLVAREGDVVGFDVLKGGFEFDGRRQPVMHRQRGIYVPAGSRYALSLKTSVRGSYPDRFESDDTLIYAMERGGPEHRENRACIASFEAGLPLVYIDQVEKGPPARYVLVHPVWIVGVDGDSFRVEMEARPSEALRGASAALGGASVVGDRASAFAHRIERRYKDTLIRRRLHQARFRERVLGAYGRSCAMCRLRHPRLLEAAHIDPDSDDLGEPVVNNGLSLCRLHHGAFDLGYLSVEPGTHRVRVRPSLLAERDGPMLQHGLQALEAPPLALPRVRGDWPDPERLARHFAAFERGAAG